MFRLIEQRKKQNQKELAESYTESSINDFKTILRNKIVIGKHQKTKRYKYNGVCRLRIISTVGKKFGRSFAHRKF